MCNNQGDETSRNKGLIVYIRAQVRFITTLALLTFPWRCLAAQVDQNVEEYVNCPHSAINDQTSHRKHIPQILDIRRATI